MRWPEWLSSRRKHAADDETRADASNSSSPSRSVEWNDSLNAVDWTHYTSAKTITIVTITSLTTLALSRLYRIHLRRIPTVDHLSPGILRRRNLYGYVTRVGDGDNFHLFHTPGGRLAGWGWFPGRRVQDLKAKELKDRTIHVRIAGIDAPELAHFGRPAQPYAQEAIEWLRGFVLHRYVRTYPYRKDQYERVVCSVVRRRWLLFRADVGLNMIRQGLATVYEAKFGSEFGNREEQYREAETRAKKKKTGMWSQTGGFLPNLLGGQGPVETPREYKSRMAREEKNAKTADLAK